MGTIRNYYKNNLLFVKKQTYPDKNIYPQTMYVL